MDTVKIRDRVDGLRHKTALVRAASLALRSISDEDVISGINACCSEIEDELRSVSDDLEEQPRPGKASLRVAEG